MQHMDDIKNIIESKSFIGRGLRILFISIVIIFICIALLLVNRVGHMVGGNIGSVIIFFQNYG